MAHKWDMPIGKGQIIKMMIKRHSKGNSLWIQNLEKKLTTSKAMAIYNNGLLVLKLMTQNTAS